MENENAVAEVVEVEKVKKARKGLKDRICESLGVKSLTPILTEFADVDDWNKLVKEFAKRTYFTTSVPFIKGLVMAGIKAGRVHRGSALHTLATTKVAKGKVSFIEANPDFFDKIDAQADSFQAVLTSALENDYDISEALLRKTLKQGVHTGAIVEGSPLYAVATEVRKRGRQKGQTGLGGGRVAFVKQHEEILATLDQNSSTLEEAHANIVAMGVKVSLSTLRKALRQMAENGKIEQDSPLYAVATMVATGNKKGRVAFYEKDASILEKIDHNATDFDAAYQSLRNLGVEVSKATFRKALMHGVQTKVIAKTSALFAVAATRKQLLAAATM